MRVELRLDSISQSWSIRVLAVSHNYSPSVAPTAYPVHRLAALDPATRTTISTISQASLAPSQILTILRTSNPDIPLVLKDIANITQQARLKQLGGRTPIEWLMDVRSLSFT
jgi:hypothetical protein